jgi:hypothetical protein
MTMKTPRVGTLVEGIDFYREGTAIVFTAAYHLKRGYCCNSKCRHCPYGGVPSSLGVTIVGLPTKPPEGGDR